MGALGGTIAAAGDDLPGVPAGALADAGVSGKTIASLWRYFQLHTNQSKRNRRHVSGFERPCLGRRRYLYTLRGPVFENEPPNESVARSVASDERCATHFADHRSSIRYAASP